MLNILRITFYFKYLLGSKSYLNKIIYKFVVIFTFDRITYNPCNKVLNIKKKNDRKLVITNILRKKLRKKMWHLNSTVKFKL
jgi:hypothetical protein